MSKQFQKMFWYFLIVTITLVGASGCHHEDTQSTSVTLPNDLLYPHHGIAVMTHRFADNGNGTISDLDTGLIWLKAADCFGPQTQPEAIMTVKSLENGMCGLTDSSRAGDWRVPHIKELLSILDYSRYDPVLPAGNPFANLHAWYWSSTPFLSSQEDSGWIVNLNDGDVGTPPQSFIGFALPVRGEYVLTPRLVDNGDGTVTDMETGLIWLKDANCFGLNTPGQAMVVSGALANGICGLMDGSNPGDWRLPDIKELLSLLDYDQYDVALPVGHPFVNVATYYWSSTVFSSNSDQVWNVYFTTGLLGPAGDLGADPVDILGFVLPVRGFRW